MTQAHDCYPADRTLGRDEMAVYDTLVSVDCALCVADLATRMTSARLAACDLTSDLDDAIDSLVADGLCWRDGNLVGLVEAADEGDYDDHNCGNAAW